MSESILISIKKQLGLDKEYTAFDPDIIMLINSALMVLIQLGVGPAAGFVVADESALWKEFSSRKDILAMIPTFVWLKVRLGFDPPANSFLVKAIEDQIAELTWRINIQAEGGPNFAINKTETRTGRGIFESCWFAANGSET